MARLPIIVAPDPRLKQRSRPVAEVDDAVRRLADSLLETMYDAQGIGLAAPQVGILQRIIVVDLAGEDEAPAPLRLINPRIIAAADHVSVREEGCLSLPGHYAEVERPARARIACLDETGTPRVIAAEGMLATCIQHEIDHLDGILFVDRVSRLRRSRILRKLGKMKKTDPARYMAA